MGVVLSKILEGVATHKEMVEQFGHRPDASDEDLRSGTAYAGRWFEIDEQSYEEMLDLLPPLFMRSGMFAMSEFRAGSVASVFFAISIVGRMRFFHGWCDLADRRSPEAMRAGILSHETKPTNVATREQILEAIWANTHPDYRGIAGEANANAWPREHRGKKTILVNGGSGHGAQTSRASDGRRNRRAATPCRARKSPDREQLTSSDQVCSPASSNDAGPAGHGREGGGDLSGSSKGPAHLFRRPALTISQPGRAPTLPLSKIRPGDNPRRYFDPKKHDELVASLLARGMLQPVLLRPAPDADDMYDLVAGERRYRAAKEAFGPNGEVPVTIREMTDQEALEAAIDENDIRDDASETEQADAAVRVLAACQGDRAEATRRLGWSRTKLDRRIALAELSETVKRALDERRIKVGHAELLAAVPGDKQDKALYTILSAGLDVGKTRELLMRVTQDLGAASFDRSECTICPFNSASQRTLFETYIDDGHCTNPACFELKTQSAEIIRFEEQERADKAARAAASSTDEADGTMPDEGELALAPNASEADHAESRPGEEAAPARTAPKPATTGSPAQKSAVSAQSIASRTSDLREATWRTALARTLAGNPAQARITILVAAMTGTLSQIRSNTLTARAGLLVDPAFPDLDYRGKIATVRTLEEPQALTVLSAIGAAYARDVSSFAQVADLARAFDVDIRDVWQVDQPFLDRFTKDELRFVAHECGLVAHMGEKAFARLLAAKKTDLIAGMLKPTGFDWRGRLPGGMTLDGQFGPPIAIEPPTAPATIADLAA